MSLHRLEIFVCVAKHRHITRAAQELRISQPSVSRQLKALEEDFGLVLHRKLSHGVELTPDGERFLKGAESILLQYDQLRANFKTGDATGDAEYLRIGASFYPSTSHLPALLTRFRQSHARVKIVSKFGVSEDLEHQVLDGELELALITSRGQSERVVYEPCGTGRW